MSDRLVCPSCGDFSQTVLTEDGDCRDGFHGVCDACTFEWEPANSPLMAALRGWFIQRHVWQLALSFEKPTESQAAAMAAACFAFQASEDCLIREFALADSQGWASMERAKSEANGRGVATAEELSE